MNLLTELERQQRYLDQLPKNFAFPLFNAKKALDSQRRSGYRDTAAAAREIVDNAIEAGARHVHVVFDTTQEGKRIVTNVAFVDDGPGMLPGMTRYALTWGGGTHTEDPAFIGKFGFGLPNSSINQTRRTEVYTRTVPAGPITRAVLDLDLYATDFGVQTIPEPEVVDRLPAFVERYLKREHAAFETGTVVVWAAPDRLTYRTPDNLKRLLVDDFGTTYRYLLDDVVLKVQGGPVHPVDPLFVTPGFRLYVAPEEGGAREVEDAVIPVVVRRDTETGDLVYERLVNPEVQALPDAPDFVLASAFRVKVARFPYGFVRGEPRYKGTDAHARFQIRKTRRGISFVRARREIETVDAFPRSSQEEAREMGNWPLLQSYAYHFGMEIRFEPELDELFGITNDKQAVRPAEAFWKLMAAEGVDALLREEDRWQRVTRKKERADETAAATQQPDVPTPAELAAHAADYATGDGASVPPAQFEQARENFEAAVRALQEAEDLAEDEARDRLSRRAKRSRYAVEFVEAPSGPAWEPARRGLQVVVRVNKAHPFFEEVYAPLLALPEALGARLGLDLFLIALSKSELEADEPMRLWYEGQRARKWSDFLGLGLRHLAHALGTLDEDEPPEYE